MAKKKQDAPVKTGNVNDELEAELAQTAFASLVDLAENLSDMAVECVSTGFPQLDVILHTEKKGLPLGRDVEIYSREPEVGKTSMSLEFIRSFQAQGLRTAVIDVERTLTVEYLHTCGIITDPKVDPTKYALRIVRPEEAMCAEQILDLIQSTSNIFDLVVIDSVAAMDLKANLEKTADEPNRMGGIAKNLSDFFRKNVMKRACVVWVNQTRQAIGGYNPTGNIRYTTMGGRAMPFFASIRMELSLVEKVKGANDEVFAYKVKVFTAKNKVSVQWKTATLTYVMGEGFSTTYDYLDLGLKMGVIEKKGAWLMFGTERAQGEMKFYHLMKTKPELLEAIRQAVEGQDDFESEVVDGLAQPVAG